MSFLFQFNEDWMSGSKDMADEATSNLLLTITGSVPHVILVREEGKVDKTRFLRKNPIS